MLAGGVRGGNGISSGGGVGAIVLPVKLPNLAKTHSIRTELS